MVVISCIGIAIGIAFVYSLLTWGLSMIWLSPSADDFDIAATAWFIGAIAFILLAIFTLTKFGLMGGA